MKRRELLTIFVLAVLVTGGSYYLPGPFYQAGAPLPFYAVAVSHYFKRRRFVPEILILDILFWFLVLAGVWFLFKRIRKKGGEENV